MKAVFGAVLRFFRWVRRQLGWVADQVTRLIGEPLGDFFRWVRRGLSAIKGWIERAIDWFLDIVHRVFKTGRTGERVREERVGANAVPLLATLTLAFAWYLVPIARWLDYGPTRFVLVGFVIWVVALVAWLSRCRADRRGRVALFAQRVHRSTGLRRLDQLLLVPVLFVCYLTFDDVQLLPLAFGSAVAVFGLLAVEHTFRPALLGPVVWDRTEASEEWAEPQPAPGSIRRGLTWSVTAHGAPRRHTAEVWIDPSALDRARSDNPGFGEPSAMIDWVLHGTGPEIESLARQIDRSCFQGAYSLFATVSCYVAAVQSIPYREDVESTGHEEYWRYPIETLADLEGDCEDSAVLLAALLRRAGFRCALVLAPGHAAVAVEVPHDSPGAYFERDGVRYYYCETTASGFMVGEAPDDIDEDQTFDFVPVASWGDS